MVSCSMLGRDVLRLLAPGVCRGPMGGGFVANSEGAAGPYMQSLPRCLLCSAGEGAMGAGALRAVSW